MTTTKSDSIRFQPSKMKDPRSKTLKKTPRTLQETSCPAMAAVTLNCTLGEVMSARAEESDAPLATRDPECEVGTPCYYPY